MALEFSRPWGWACKWVSRMLTWGLVVREQQPLGTLWSQMGGKQGSEGSLWGPPKQLCYRMEFLWAFHCSSCHLSLPWAFAKRRPSEGVSAREKQWQRRKKAKRKLENEQFKGMQERMEGGLRKSGYCSCTPSVALSIWYYLHPTFWPNLLTKIFALTGRCPYLCFIDGDLKGEDWSVLPQEHTVSEIFPAPRLSSGLWRLKYLLITLNHFMSCETSPFSGFQDIICHSCSVHFLIREHCSIVFPELYQSIRIMKINDRIWEIEAALEIIEFSLLTF